MADTVKKKKNVQLNRIEIKCTNNIRGESGICCILRGKMLHNVSLFRDFFLSLVLTLNSPQSHPSKSQTRAPPPPRHKCRDENKGSIYTRLATPHPSTPPPPHAHRHTPQKEQYLIERDVITSKHKTCFTFTDKSTRAQTQTTRATTTLRK